MTAAADSMVKKRSGISLLDVGYENCGLDDYYQACKTYENAVWPFPCSTQRIAVWIVYLRSDLWCGILMTVSL